jgi:SAM-dependent methyltransferase
LNINSPEEKSIETHKKYALTDKISYEAINATGIPYSNHFDIVIFKSILGGISRKGNDELKGKVIKEIYKSLKPGGRVLFAENLAGSYLHKFMRRKFVSWGKEWNYLKYNEVDDIFSDFTSLNFITTGFWASFGRSERQRQFLGMTDNIFEKLIPKSKRYIVIGIAEK